MALFSGKNYVLYNNTKYAAVIDKGTGLFDAYSQGLGFLCGRSTRGSALSYIYEIKDEEFLVLESLVSSAPGLADLQVKERYPEIKDGVYCYKGLGVKVHFSGAFSACARKRPEFLEEPDFVWMYDELIEFKFNEGKRSKIWNHTHELTKIVSKYPEAEDVSKACQEINKLYQSDYLRSWVRAPNI